MTATTIPEPTFDLLAEIERVQQAKKIDLPAASVLPFAPRVRTPYQRFDPTRVVGTMTIDEWDQFIERATEKYHYVYGEVVQMAGASPEHNLLQMNTGRALGNALEEASSDCEVLGSDQRVYVRDNLYYFPDLVVVCGVMQIDTRDALRNPAAIIEILSPTTENDDRTDKFREYRQIPTLRHYLLVDQSRVSVTHYEKTEADVWAVRGDYRALSDAVTLRFGETSIAVPLSRVYRNVPLIEVGNQE